MAASTRLQDISTEAQLQRALASSEAAVLHFWAPWCEPCAQIDKVLDLLATDHEATFLRVEAEEATELSLRFEVSAVPLLLFFKGAEVVDRLEGADVDALRASVAKLSPVRARPDDARDNREQSASMLAGRDSQTSLGSGGAALDRVRQIIGSQRVVLLMKGTPAQPRCGFSQRVVAILQRLGVPFGSFDVLSDESVRQGAKKLADWPSYPQLYVDGSFLGGCDIIEEMEASGELARVLKFAANGKQEAQQSLEERLSSLVHSADVMLFMKGSPDAPRCGFSAKVVQALRSVQVPFESFDILQDEEVRSGLKKYSDWPTFPQLYAGGEFLGGCDIVLELLKLHELKSEIQSTLKAAAAAAQNGAQPA